MSHLLSGFRTSEEKTDRGYGRDFCVEKKIIKHYAPSLPHCEAGLCDWQQKDVGDPEDFTYLLVGGLKMLSSLDLSVTP